jgi:hypothetical protein
MRRRYAVPRDPPSGPAAGIGAGFHGTGGGARRMGAEAWLPKDGAAESLPPLLGA